MQLYNKLSAIERAELIDKAGKDRLTISFYQYYKIQNPQLFRDKLFLEWNALDVLGRIYVSYEGINAQLSVPSENFYALKEQLYTLFDIVNKTLHSFLLNAINTFIVPFDHTKNYYYNGSKYEKTTKSIFYRRCYKTMRKFIRR